MYYLIKNRLTEVSMNECFGQKDQYVAVITSREWMKNKELFDLGIDLELEAVGIRITKAEVNYDSLTGTFYIPSRRNFSQADVFAFALDEKGIVFIDNESKAGHIIRKIRQKRWRFPSLERFLYDFLEQILEQIIEGDRELLEHYEKKLDDLAAAIIADRSDGPDDGMGELSNGLRKLRIHYEQLLDLAQELEQNDNHFFKPDNLRYFRLFANQIERLRDMTVAVNDHIQQVRDIYTAHLDIKQNRIMTILTIVTTIFMPLTLIVGWYGMNFKYMPELDSRWGYPAVICLSLSILLGSLLVLKKKKWM